MQSKTEIKDFSLSELCFDYLTGHGRHGCDGELPPVLHVGLDGGEGGGSRVGKHYSAES